MNDQLIFTDGRVVYATFESKIRGFVKWILIGLNLLVYSCLIALVAYNSDIIAAVLCMLVTVAFTLTRSTLWNLFGRESLMISKNYLNHNKDFGVFKTNTHSIDISNGLLVQKGEKTGYENDDMFSIQFFSYDENDIPLFIYQTGIKSNDESYSLLLETLDELYKQDDLSQINLN